MTALVHNRIMIKRSFTVNMVIQQDASKPQLKILFCNVVTTHVLRLVAMFETLEESAAIVKKTAAIW